MFSPIRNKFIDLSALSVVTFGSLGCGSVKDAIDNLLSFSIERSIPEQQIDGQVVPCQVARALNIELPILEDMTISKEEDFPEQNTEVNLIREAYLSVLNLSLTEGSAAEDWDFLDSITFSVAANNLETVEVAKLDPVPDDLTALALSPLGVNLANYLKSEGGFSFEVTATGCPPSADVLFNGEIKIDVSASPL